MNVSRLRDVLKTVRFRLEDALVSILPDRFEPLISIPRMLLFLTVGVVGMVSELSVLVTLVEAFNLHPYMAGVAGKETAILVMFALNDRFTFATEGTNRVPALLKRLVRSHGVRFVGIAIAYAIFVALIHWGDVWYLLADVVGIGVGVVINYVLENVFTWRTL